MHADTALPEHLIDEDLDHAALAALLRDADAGTAGPGAALAAFLVRNVPIEDAIAHLREQAEMPHRADAIDVIARLAPQALVACG